MKNIYKLKFKLQKDILSGIKVSKNKKDLVNFLFLHGGGTADKYRTFYLADKLLENNIASISFDHSGSGESSGIMSESSLQKRCKESKNILKNFLNLEKELTICGSSMGCYVALKMLELDFKITNLILFCPGIYDKKAFDIKFNEQFSKIIRQKESWKNSDIFTSLEKFQGNLLVVIGEDDDLIPDKVIRLLDKHSSQVQKKEIIKLKGVSHSIHKELAKNEKLANFVTGKIAEFIG